MPPDTINASLRMNLTYAIMAACLSTFIASPAFARSPRPELRTVPELIELARQHDPEAIERLGIWREEKARDVLEEIAKEPDTKNPKRNRARFLARIALARMGEDIYFGGFIRDLQSPDADHRIACLDALGRIQDKRAVRHLIPLLDEADLATRTEQSLASIVPEVANSFIEKRDGKGSNSPNDWKLWWKGHQASYP